MNILVTGGAGYLGSTLVGRLLEERHDVTVVDNLLHGGEGLLSYCPHPDFHFVKADARDWRVMQTFVRQSDIIIPLAAIVGAPACDLNIGAAWATNCDAVQMLVEGMSRDQMIIYPNTNSGYGSAGTVCTEETPLRPISVYGQSKQEAEEHVLVHDNAIVFRLATVFGVSPRMRVDLLVNDFVHRAVTDGSIVLFEGNFRRNFVHVQDVASAFVRAIYEFDRMKGRAYNVGDSRANLTKRELAEAVQRHVPGLSIFESESRVDPDKRDYIVSNARIEAAGWMPARTLDDGIRELIRAFSLLKARRHANV